MFSFSATETLLLLSALTGAVHVLAPDHWFPASVLTWQRNLTFIPTFLLSFFIYLIHMLLGAAIYFIFLPFFHQLRSDFLFPFTLILLFSGLFLRLSRFPRLEEVLRSGTSSSWGFFVVISLLWPCESLIPILIKSGKGDIGYLLPFLAFFGGTVISGYTAIWVGQYFWKRPALFSQSLAWANQKNAALPVLLVLTVGLSLLFRIT
jgi:hypothetical protein